MQDRGYILAMSDVELRRQRRQLLTSDSIGYYCHPISSTVLMIGSRCVKSPIQCE
ncbi:hypothetical protein ASPBRDRAFT_42523 [Aspergillus brasiliensis CBS 101740]|uniref:Uncharacterized protein n=1 Tax=Aspergillus brasiliensis (strain CBS 101740 / IMI 381727 / IBT 21946) TaxID=767769 RepID=A0A1L9UMQ0_ASPBC|nr:hypothetical protein ASPBRDRAFT_42523 [Aspergillus brasiliensis CBS 101740]